MNDVYGIYERQPEVTLGKPFSTNDKWKRPEAGTLLAELSPDLTTIYRLVFSVDCNFDSEVY